MTLSKGNEFAAHMMVEETVEFSEKLVSFGRQTGLSSFIVVGAILRTCLGSLHEGTIGELGDLVQKFGEERIAAMRAKRVQGGEK